MALVSSTFEEGCDPDAAVGGGTEGGARTARRRGARKQAPSRGSSFAVAICRADEAHRPLRRDVDHSIYRESSEQMACLFYRERSNQRGAPTRVQASVWRDIVAAPEATLDNEQRTSRARVLMKPLPLSFALILLVFAVGLHASDADKVITAVRLADDARVAATLAGDIETLKAIYSDDMYYAHSSGKLDSKSSQLEGIVTGLYKYTKFDYQQRIFTPIALRRSS